MKVQMQGQGVRFRIDEAELAALLAGTEAVNRTVLPGAGELVQSLGLGARSAPALDCGAGHWRLSLPRADVEAYVARLPCRDGLEYQVQGLALAFEVDVRDSARKRLPRQAPATGRAGRGGGASAPSRP